MDFYDFNFDINNLEQKNQFNLPMIQKRTGTRIIRSQSFFYIYYYWNECFARNIFQLSIYVVRIQVYQLNEIIQCVQAYNQILRLITQYHHLLLKCVQTLISLHNIHLSQQHLLTTTSDGISARQINTARNIAHCFISLLEKYLR